MKTQKKGSHLFSCLCGYEGRLDNVQRHKSKCTALPIIINLQNQLRTRRNMAFPEYMKNTKDTKDIGIQCQLSSNHTSTESIESIEYSGNTEFAAHVKDAKDVEDTKNTKDTQHTKDIEDTKDTKDEQNVNVECTENTSQSTKLAPSNSCDKDSEYVRSSFRFFEPAQSSIDSASLSDLFYENESSHVMRTAEKIAYGKEPQLENKIVQNIFRVTTHDCASCVLEYIRTKYLQKYTSTIQISEDGILKILEYSDYQSIWTEREVDTFLTLLLERNFDELLEKSVPKIKADSHFFNCWYKTYKLNNVESEEFERVRENLKLMIIEYSLNSNDR